MEARAHVVITGMVHGVGFRAFIFRHARHMRIAGWVRNAGDEKVEAVFEGRKYLVERMVELCKKGPVTSVVDDVDVRWEEPEGSNSFYVRY
ncbi:MAG: acylphosphatase [Candidatus Aenigmarchaeota archaeon]|nr:acylphosphatase [Candidatus Aenigmarchaeota archaeon]